MDIWSNSVGLGQQRWASLTSAAGWLRSQASLGVPKLRGSLTGAGLRNMQQTGPITPLRDMEKLRLYRNSGTSVDGEVVELYSPLHVTPPQASQFQAKSVTDGCLGQVGDKDLDLLRDTVTDLSHEVERQRLETQRLQNSVDLHQRLIVDLLQLDSRINDQEVLLKEILETQSKDSTVLELGLLSICSILCKTVLSWSPVQFILACVHPRNLRVWVLKCLSVMLSFVLYVLLKSWTRIFDLSKKLNKLESVVCRVLKLVFIPLSRRTRKVPNTSTQCLVPERDKASQ